LQLVGLHVEHTVQDRDAASLSISSSGSDRSAPIAITAVSIAPEVYYRLDARLTNDQPALTIDGSDVLFSIGLRFGDLGFVGRIGSRTVPVELKDPAAPIAARPAAYVAQLRVNRPLKAMHWRLEDGVESQPEWAVYSGNLSVPYRIAKLQIARDKADVDLVIKVQNASDSWSIQRIPLSLP
jgi:hypothetical protein